MNDSQESLSEVKFCGLIKSQILGTIFYLYSLNRDPQDLDHQLTQRSRLRSMIGIDGSHCVKEFYLLN